jgi:hypothetical protein
MKSNIKALVFFHICKKSLYQVFLQLEDINCNNLDWISGSLENTLAINDLQVVGIEVAYLLMFSLERELNF